MVIEWSWVVCSDPPPPGAPLAWFAIVWNHDDDDDDDDDGDGDWVIVGCMQWPTATWSTAGNPLWTSSAPSSYPVNRLHLKEDEEEIHTLYFSSLPIIFAKRERQQSYLICNYRPVNKPGTGQCANEAQLDTNHVSICQTTLFWSKFFPLNPDQNNWVVRKLRTVSL